MQLKTSFFHKALCKKSFTRFAPIWIAYTVIWFFMLPMQMLTYHYPDYSMASHVLGSGIGFGSVLTFFYAIVVCMALYSYLYSSKSIYTLAALPIRRESMFCTHFITGLLFCVLPNLFVLLCSFVTSAVSGYAVALDLLRWFAMIFLQYLFFFGFATFCAMLTGHIIALPALYVVLNFTVVVIEHIVRAILAAFLYGMSGGSTTVLDKFSPLVHLVLDCNVEEVATTAAGAANSFQISYSYQFHHWVYLLILAAVGAVFTILAFFLYRNRRMEAAGDVISVPVLRPIFKYCFTVGCSLVLGLLLAQILCSQGADEIGLHPIIMTVSLLIGGFIGYFIAEMMLQKSLRVFRGHWRGFGIVAACICLAAATVQLDLFGYENYLPNADEIQQATVSCYGDRVVLEDLSYISDLLVWHQSVVSDKERQQALLRGDKEYRFSRVYVDLSYELKNGKSVERSYTLLVSDEDREDPSSPVRQFDALFNSKEFVMLRYQELFDYTPSQLDYAQVYGHNADGEWISLELTSEQGNTLLHECIYQDMLDGTIGADPILGASETLDATTYYDLEISFQFNRGSNNYRPYSSGYEYFHPTSKSVRTLAFLESLGFDPSAFE